MKSTFRLLNFPTILGVFLVACSQPAGAAVMLYTATGGLISGSLNSVPFTDASWSISTIANTEDITSGVISSLIPYYFLPATSTISISGVGSATFTLPNFGVFSGDYDAIMEGVALDGFINLESGFGYGFAIYGDFTSLDAPVSFVSASIANLNTYPTTQGDLIIASDSGGTGAFMAIPIPEPATHAAIFGVLAFGFAIFRRRRH